MLDMGKKILMFDGGMGTQLQAAGLQPGEEPERWNLSHADVVRGVHSRFPTQWLPVWAAAQTQWDSSLAS